MFSFINLNTCIFQLFYHLKDIVYIKDKPRAVIENYQQQVMASKSLIVSLVYTDKSSQLRDNLFAQESKVRFFQILLW